MARERGIVSLVDGAQSFGLMDVDLSDWQPDFFSGSAHKWPCGPKETGVLFVNERMHEEFWPSMYSAYSGSRGLSRTHEGMGQRDTPALHTFGVQIEFLQSIGQNEIEARSRELASMLVEELSALDGVHMWTPAQADRRGAVVTFQPGELEGQSGGGRARRRRNRGGSSVVAATAPGVRFSPHFYNTGGRRRARGRCDSAISQKGPLMSASFDPQIALLKSALRYAEEYLTAIDERAGLP